MLKKFVRWFTTNGATETVAKEPDKYVEPVALAEETEPVAKSASINFIDDASPRRPQPLPVKSYQERMRQDIQTLFDNPPSRQVIKLVPQEYPGPLFIKKPMIIDGQGATLWAFKGPVLHIQAPTVALKNINIEVTGETFANGSEECALCVDSSASVHFENVQVRGQVLGIQGESGEWQYPLSLHLGKLAKETTHRFRLRIMIPTPCSIESAIYGLHLTPTVLAAGPREIEIKIDPLRQDTSLYGHLYLNTTLIKRRIHLTAHISAEANPSTHPVSSRVIWVPPTWPTTTTAIPVSPPQTAVTTTPSISPRKLPKVSQLPIEKRESKVSTTPPSSSSVKPWLAVTPSAASSEVSKPHLGRIEESVFFKQGGKPNQVVSEEKPENVEASEKRNEEENVFLKTMRRK